ncbi:tRNA (adenosine(37)-N6)-threonylcarbamoyltransferase complex ATPase subunit type 1 TsaE [Patescibacteria group bacterium]|nr:tRNA (adenosine(37)-N6)-threonylcarbamoyltransferase complex ATPase subunit type 1 TsaE [Patescibacteria group bacterium]MBU2036534.1 tRNA (adenosine(37)-N6)-threonylcarbamoyltransferase complex ATPase subunit type 1 TsaE [Patescibacteria group bacterium]
MEFITKSARETQKLGRKVAADLVKKTPTVIALTGNLGSGKTTFVQGFARGLGIKKKIISPTFILMRTYKAKKRKMLYHLDLYRLESNFKEEIENLGVKDIWKEKKNILVIEWAEKIKDILPEGTSWIKFEYLPDDQRKIIIE